MSNVPPVLYAPRPIPANQEKEIEIQRKLKIYNEAVKFYDRELDVKYLNLSNSDLRKLIDAVPDSRQTVNAINLINQEIQRDSNRLQRITDFTQKHPAYRAQKIQEIERRKNTLNTMEKKLNQLKKEGIQLEETLKDLKKTVEKQPKAPIDLTLLYNRGVEEKKNKQMLSKLARIKQTNQQLRAILARIESATKQFAERAKIVV